MPTDRTTLQTLSRALLALLALAPLSLRAETMAAPIKPLLQVDTNLIYAMLALAVVQVIFILAMAGIMRPEVRTKKAVVQINQPHSGTVPTWGAPTLLALVGTRSQCAGLCGQFRHDNQLPTFLVACGSERLSFRDRVGTDQRAPWSNQSDHGKRSRRSCTGAAQRPFLAG